MRSLASIQRIDELHPIEGADRILRARILGWNVVVNKSDNFQVGQLVVYCEIDSILPERPEFEFLRPRKFRIKTIKLRGQVSQGIIFPLSVLCEQDLAMAIEEYGPGALVTNYHFLGEDVTELLGVTKYDPETREYNSFCSGHKVHNFPDFLFKTDETRVQSKPGVIAEIYGKPYYITTKCDGTSCTFFFTDSDTAGRFGVCSRNNEVSSDPSNVYWDMAKKYNIEDKLRAMGVNIAIQGEICGPGIQKNRLNLKDKEFLAFSIFDIDNKCYVDSTEFLEICANLDLQTVPIWEVGDSFPYYTVDELVKLAEGKYPNGHNREGIVIRPQTEEFSNVLKDRLSFKVINNAYLLETETDE